MPCREALDSEVLFSLRGLAVQRQPPAAIHLGSNIISQCEIKYISGKELNVFYRELLIHIKTLAFKILTFDPTTGMMPQEGNGHICPASMAVNTAKHAT